MSIKRILGQLELHLVYILLCCNEYLKTDDYRRMQASNLTGIRDELPFGIDGGFSQNCKNVLFSKE